MNEKQEKRVGRKTHYGREDRIRSWLCKQERRLRQTPGNPQVATKEGRSKIETRTVGESIESQSVLNKEGGVTDTQ